MEINQRTHLSTIDSFQKLKPPSVSASRRRRCAAGAGPARVRLSARSVARCRSAAPPVPPSRAATAACRGCAASRATGCRKATQPAPHRRTADGGAPRHLQYRRPLGGKQDDPSPQHVLVRAASVTGDCGKTRALFGVQKDTHILSHAWRIARHPPLVNPFNGSVR